MTNCMNEWTLTAPIIDGSTCTVYYGVDSRGIGVAIKVLDKKNELKIAEVMLNRHYNHPNIISVIGTAMFMCPRDLKMKYGIVFPICDTDLRRYLLFMKKGLSSEKNLWTQHEVKLQTAQAVYCMHQEGYCHRDLKPENFLVSSFKDGSVLIQLTDLAESKRSSEEKSDGEPVHTTWWYQAPEVKSGEKISHPASDTFSLGVIFCEIERTTEPNDIENDIVPVAYFSHLAQDMMQHDFRIRPDMLTVLQRLGMSAELLCISGKPWKNAFVDEQDVMSDDNNIGHHRILALLLSDKSDHVETAYWLLNEIAMQEASSSSFRVQSVLLILPYFHANIRANVNNNDDRSTFTKLLYCQALQALCQRPYFVLSDEMRLNLQAFSIIPACERSVVVVVARVAERFPSVLLSCEVDGVWGKLGDTFEWFAYGFVNDWSNLEVATAARNMFPVAQAPLPDQIASG